jgi:hypothetical protein
MKLFLRRANSPLGGVLLRQNHRWIDAKWSPDSRFLALIDHLDGHISDVCVFGVAAAGAVPTLVYHTPDLHSYDVKWDVSGWDVSRREVVLDKEVKHEIAGKITHEKIIERIATKPLKFNEPNRPNHSMKPTAPMRNEFSARHDTLPWLISFSLGARRDVDATNF